jgi:hypothetical protein
LLHLATGGGGDRLTAAEKPETLQDDYSFAFNG